MPNLPLQANENRSSEAHHFQISKFIWHFAVISHGTYGSSAIFLYFSTGAHGKLRGTRAAGGAPSQKKTTKNPEIYFENAAPSNVLVNDTIFGIFSRTAAENARNTTKKKNN